MAITADQTDHTIKTYRYLRITIVGVSVALLLGVFLDYLNRGELETSISAYYYTEIRSLFVGALVMMGASYVAIRGTNNLEEVVLNLTGMMAPIVAFVPTARSSAPEVPLLNANVWATMGAVVMTVAMLVAMGRSRSASSGEGGSPAKSRRLRYAAIVLAVVVVAGFVAADNVWGQRATHWLAAVVFIAGLWAVTTGNALRSIQLDGESSPSRQLLGTVAGGVGIVLGPLAFWVGSCRVVDEVQASALMMMAIGALVVVVTLVWLRPGMKRFFGVLRHGDRYTRPYLVISLVMLTIGPFLWLVPFEWDHRVFFVELSELIPFAVFWLIQTYEHWDDGVRPHDSPILQVFY